LSQKFWRVMYMPKDQRSPAGLALPRILGRLLANIRNKTLIFLYARSVSF